MECMRGEREEWELAKDRERGRRRMRISPSV